MCPHTPNQDRHVPKFGNILYCLFCCSRSTDSSSTSSSSTNNPNNLATSQRVAFGPVPGWQAELLSDTLLGFGAQSVVVEEYRGEGQQEQELFGAEAELWDSCSLLVHFAIEVSPCVFLCC